MTPPLWPPPFVVRFPYGKSAGRIILAITPINLGPQALVANHGPGCDCRSALINSRSVEMEFTEQLDQFVQSGHALDTQRRRIDACLLHCAPGVPEFPGAGPAAVYLRRAAGDVARLDQR